MRVGREANLGGSQVFAVGSDGRVSIKRAITCEETREARYLQGGRSVVGCSRTHPPYGTSPLAVPLTCQKGEMHTLRRRVCDILHFEFGAVPARGRQRGPYTVGGEGVRPPMGTYQCQSARRRRCWGSAHRSGGCCSRGRCRRSRCGSAGVLVAKVRDLADVGGVMESRLTVLARRRTRGAGGASARKWRSSSRS